MCEIVVVFDTRFTNSRKYWKTNKKTAKMRFYLFWQPQPDSNWCSRLERAVSWASRRWGQNCHSNDFIQIKRWQIITGAAAFVKAKYHRAIFLLFCRFCFWFGGNRNCDCIGWHFFDNGGFFNDFCGRFDLLENDFFAVGIFQRQTTIC